MPAKNDPVTHRPPRPPTPFDQAIARAERHVESLRHALDDLTQSLQSLRNTPPSSDLRAEAVQQLEAFADRMEHCRASEAIWQAAAAVRAYAFFLESQWRLE
jgi:hypothetical protein